MNFEIDVFFICKFNVIISSLGALRVVATTLLIGPPDVTTTTCLQSRSQLNLSALLILETKSSQLSVAFGSFAFIQLVTVDRRVLKWVFLSVKISSGIFGPNSANNKSLKSYSFQPGCLSTWHFKLKFSSVC